MTTTVSHGHVGDSLTRRRRTAAARVTRCCSCEHVRPRACACEQVSPYFLTSTATRRPRQRGATDQRRQRERGHRRSRISACRPTERSLATSPRRRPHNSSSSRRCSGASLTSRRTTTRPAASRYESAAAEGKYEPVGTRLRIVQPPEPAAESARPAEAAKSAKKKTTKRQQKKPRDGEEQARAGRRRRRAAFHDAVRPRISGAQQKARRVTRGALRRARSKPSTEGPARNISSAQATAAARASRRSRSRSAARARRHPPPSMSPSPNKPATPPASRARAIDECGGPAGRQLQLADGEVAVDSEGSRRRTRAAGIVNLEAVAQNVKRSAPAPRVR